MNRYRLTIVIAAVLLVGAAIGYGIARKSAVESRPVESTAAPGAGQAAGERRILYWHDPMVPGARFDKPGKSPYMDMDLVPVYADEEGGPAVRISPVVAQNLGIRLGTVEKTTMRARLAAVGSVAFDERRLALVQARVEGYVTRLHVKAPLEHVRRGQPLAEIVARDWIAAQEEYLALLDAASERGRAVRDAARQRLRVLDVPEAAIRALEQERKVKRTTTVVAPADGVITELSVREGSSFMPGAALFRINGLDSVWVNAQLPEAQVSLVPTGSRVEARATAWPGRSFEGRVEALLPEVDPKTRAIPVRIAIDNADGKLVPGMFVTLDFEGRPGEPQLTVSSDAVIVTGERSVVIVARDGGGFDVAEVTAGAESGGRTAILAGLAEGQSVVVSGQFLIDSEASLKSALTRLDTANDEAAAEPRP